MFNNCVSYIFFKISIQQKLTTFDDSPFNRHDNHLIRSGVILRMRRHVGSKSMGGTNPNTLSGTTITVSWEPAKWSHTPLVVSHTFRIRAGSYISLALQDSPYGSFLRSSRFSSVLYSTRRPCGVHRAYPRHKPHNGTDGLTPRGEPRSTTPHSLC